MSDTPQMPDPDEGGDALRPDDEFAMLRRLLLAPEQDALAEVVQRLDDPKTRAEEVGRVLPQALVDASAQGKNLSTALMPTLQEALRASIRKDLNAIADALFPVIGPAIRKSIAEALGRMMQSFNTAIESSMTWQGLKWRIAAMRSGRPYAEVVMLNTLVYRVEQVFLIHRETSLLLSHVTAQDALTQDADLVSSMMSALQDWVRDSFHVEYDDALKSISIGDFTVWVEAGPTAVLALAIRGTPPESLRTTMRETLEMIHQDAGAALDAFSGDASEFDSLEPTLSECLASQSISPGGRSRRWMGPAVLCLILLLGGFWVAGSIRQNYRWQHHLAQLSQQPGIVVTDVKTRQGVHYVNGLRDPLAAAPGQVHDATGYPQQAVRYHLVPFISLEPQFVLNRARRLLLPPPEVTLSMTGDALLARGTADSDWIRHFKTVGPTLPGVATVVADQLENIDLDTLAPPAGVTLALNGGLLRAEGHAPKAWVSRLLEVGPAIEGVSSVDASRVALDEALEMPSVIARLQDYVIQFPSGAPVFGSDQETVFQRVVDDVHRLMALGGLLGRSVMITIIGHSDSIGAPEGNRRLSRERADFVRRRLAASGVSDGSMAVLGVGESRPLPDAPPEKNRRVTFTVSQPKPTAGATKHQ